MKLIDAKELKTKLDSKEDFILLNVLTEYNFELQRIPDSVNIPAEDIEKRALIELTDKHKEIVVYCASLQCQASNFSALALEKLGYSNVVRYEAGLAGWVEAGYELEGTDV